MCWEQEKEGNTVSNLVSTRALRDVTEKAGGQYFSSRRRRSKRGDDDERTFDAVIGGEGNGG